MGIAPPVRRRPIPVPAIMVPVRISMTGFTEADRAPPNQFPALLVRCLTVLRDIRAALRAAASALPKPIPADKQQENLVMLPAQAVTSQVLILVPVIRRAALHHLIQQLATRGALIRKPLFSVMLILATSAHGIHLIINVAINLN